MRFHFNYRVHIPGASMKPSNNRKSENDIMTDLIYLAVMVLFFVLSGIYVHLCEKM